MVHFLLPNYTLAICQISRSFGRRNQQMPTFCWGEAIVKAYPEKQWKLRMRSVQPICPRIDKTASAMNGSGRPKSARKAEIKMLKTKNQFSQGSAAAGEVGKSITFVLHIISIYSLPNTVEIGQHVQTLQQNEQGIIYYVTFRQCIKIFLNNIQHRAVSLQNLCFSLLVIRLFLQRSRSLETSLQID